MEQQSNKGAKKHVLIVDDNVELAQTYRELLLAHDYRVTLATNGVLALKMLVSTENVDAILCDLSMPQLEGDMFYMAVERSRPELCPRFVFVTGNADNPKYERFLKMAKAPVLYKPVAMDTLMETLRKAIDGGTGQTQ